MLKKKNLNDEKKKLKMKKKKFLEEAKKNFFCIYCGNGFSKKLIKEDMNCIDVKKQ